RSQEREYSQAQMHQVFSSTGCATDEAIRESQDVNRWGSLTNHTVCTTLALVVGEYAIYHPGAGRWIDRKSLKMEPPSRVAKAQQVDRYRSNICVACEKRTDECAQTTDAFEFSLRARPSSCAGEHEEQRNDNR